MLAAVLMTVACSKDDISQDEQIKNGTHPIVGKWLVDAYDHDGYWDTDIHDYDGDATILEFTSGGNFITTNVYNGQTDTEVGSYVIIDNEIIITASDGYTERASFTINGQSLIVTINDDGYIYKTRLRRL